MSHWEYACIEDPTDGDDYVSGDAMRDDRDVDSELDSMLDKLDMAIENARDMLREDDQ